MTSFDMPDAPQGFAHRFIRANGLRAHYVVGGVEHGETIVLLAGFPESWYAWRHVIPLLGERYRVVAIDLPGQGDSDRPMDGYDTQTVAERVHAFIAAMGIKRYSLVAHDVGAWVAFPYALLYGDEVTSLVLMDAGIPAVTMPEMLPTSPDRSWKTWHFAFHAVPDLPEALLQGREREYLSWFFKEKTADPTCYSEATIDEYLRIFRAPGGMRAGLSFYRASAKSAEQNKHLLRDRKLTMPVLGLSADQGSIPDIAAAIRPHATDVVGEVVVGCGHFQPEEQPAAVAEAVLRFVGGVSGRV
ncbi:alpha/beta fold hydrolase [Oryzifoliimicrobium ureilyticus]|uniref:alpha/beta fold hydrolase n=1 Tax=Oryzifoliimicrobium ureilyticus TaxID=3113724 RepID=UPI0030760C7C